MTRTHTLDRYVDIGKASDYELQREMETIIEYIARGQKVCGPGYPDPRYDDVRAIAAEQARREAARTYQPLLPVWPSDETVQ